MLLASFSSEHAWNFSKESIAKFYIAVRFNELNMFEVENQELLCEYEVFI